MVFRRRPSGSRARPVRRSRTYARRLAGVRRRASQRRRRAAFGGGHRRLVIEVVQTTQAGNGNGGTDMPQVRTQTKRSRF